MLLALDTASAVLSLAVYDGQHILAESSFRSENQHTTQLSPAIKNMLQTLGFVAQDLTCLGISQGYGSYSGLRVGFGVAKGLASALKIPIIPIPTLDIIAASTPYYDGDLLTVIPAGRKRIIAGRYSWENGNWCAQADIINTTWDDLIPRLDNIMVNGEIDPNGRELLSQAGIFYLPIAWQVRRAGFLAMLAWEHYQHSNFETNLAMINPLYLREP